MVSIGEANLLRIFRGLKIFLQLAREEEEKQMTLDEWKAKQAKHAAAFAKTRGGEQLVYFWNALSKTQNLPNIQSIHKEIGAAVVDIVRSARGLSS